MLLSVGKSTLAGYDLRELLANRSNLGWKVVADDDNLRGIYKESDFISEPEKTYMQVKIKFYSN